MNIQSHMCSSELRNGKAVYNGCLHTSICPACEGMKNFHICRYHALYFGKTGTLRCHFLPYRTETMPGKGIFRRGCNPKPRPPRPESGKRVPTHAQDCVRFQQSSDSRRTMMMTSRRLCMGEAYPVQRKTAVVTLSDIRQSGNNPCGKRAGAPLRGCSCSISDSLRTGRRPVGSALSHQFSYLLRGGHRASDAAVPDYRKHKVNPWNRRNDR